MKINPKVATENISTNNVENQPKAKCSIFYDNNNNGYVDEQDFENQEVVEYARKNDFIGKRWSVQIKEALENFSKNIKSITNNNISNETSEIDTDGTFQEHNYYDKDGRIIKTERYSIGGTENYNDGELASITFYTYNSNGQLIKKESGKPGTTENISTLEMEYDSQGRKISSKDEYYNSYCEYSEDGKTETTTVKSKKDEPLYLIKKIYNEDGSLNKEKSGFYLLNGEKTDFSPAIVEIQYNYTYQGLVPNYQE